MSRINSLRSRTLVLVISSRSRIWAGERSLSNIITSALKRSTRSASSSALPFPMYVEGLILRIFCWNLSATMAPALRASAVSSAKSSVSADLRRLAATSMARSLATFSV